MKIILVGICCLAIVLGDAIARPQAKEENLDTTVADFKKRVATLHDDIEAIKKTINESFPLYLKKALENSTSLLNQDQSLIKLKERLNTANDADCQEIFDDKYNKTEKDFVKIIQAKFASDIKSVKGPLLCLFEWSLDDLSENVDSITEEDVKCKPREWWQVWLPACDKIAKISEELNNSESTVGDLKKVIPVTEDGQYNHWKEEASNLVKDKILPEVYSCLN